MRTLTPQQIAAAAAKRAASVAARKATGGMTVRQQRAAAAAAKAGQPFTPPAPKAPRAPRAPRTFGGRRRRRGGFASMPPPPSAPVFATPPSSLRALRLSALTALEAAFKANVAEKQKGVPTQEQRDLFATYKKVLTRAIAPSPDEGSANEADVALRQATLALVKLAF